MKFFNIFFIAIILFQCKTVSYTKQEEKEITKLFPSNTEFKNPPNFWETGMFLIDNNYIIGAGDRFKVYITGSINVDFNIIVGTNGKVFVPLIGEIYSVNKTIKYLREEIKRKLSAYYKEFEVYLQLFGRSQISPFSKKASIFYIRGEVLHPGIYELRKNDTVIDAIYSAGGFRTSANLRHVYIKRIINEKETIINIDLYKVLVEKSKDLSLKIKNGDVIVIPLIPRVISVSGEVSNPNAYPYTDGASIYYYIGLAGGFTEKASKDNIEIIKINGKKTRDKNYIPLPGDIILVHKAFLSFSTFRDYMQLVFDFLAIYTVYTVIFNK